MTHYEYADWIPTIGLEVHVQLSTKTKLFSRAPNRYGDEPNTNVGIADTGQPGSLPCINAEAVKKAILFGLATHAEIQLVSKFDRKSYFYPDNPRNFQITQFEHPIMKGGFIEADVDGTLKRFDIHHAHIEDDTGMLKHFTSFSGIDYNRAGAPLIEVVSMPCMYSPKEAAAYAMALRSIMEYIGASDGNMEEGSLRIDVNVSVRKKEETKLRNKVEIKNMNSFSNMQLAIEAEILRQIRLYTDGKEVPQATCRFDVASKEIIIMRTKESAEDYRYFPEPDLPPLIVTKEFIEKLRLSMPELPADRYRRYTDKLGISHYNAALLINDKKLCDVFEEGLKHAHENAKALCNWMTVEFVGRIKSSGKTLSEFGLKAAHIAELVSLINNGTITGRIAKDVADEMVASPGVCPSDIIKANPNYRPMTDLSEIEKIVDAVVAQNTESVQDYHAGKEKAFQFLIGQVMKESKGKASPELVKNILKTKIKAT